MNPMFMRRVAELLEQHAYLFADERNLHQAISELLRKHEIAFEHERVSGKDRFDFYLTEEQLVIEVKVDGAFAAAARQVDRYCAREDVAGVLIASTRRWGKAREPINLRGKPVQFVYLSAQAF